MKNKLCLIAILAIISFSFAACSDGGGGGGGGGNGNGNGNDKTPITVAEITINVPVNGGTPKTTVNSEAERFTAGTVTWSPKDNPFKPNTEYTATVTLTAKSGFTFTGLNANNAKINGTVASVLGNTGETVMLSHKFSATSTKIVLSIAIKSSPTKMTYTHGDKLDLSGMVVTLTYDDNTTKDVAPVDFENNGITANPSQGAHLEHSEYDGKQITITYGNLTLKTTGNLTVTAIPVSVLTIDAIPAQTFTGSAITPSVTVKHTVEGSTRTLQKDTDYTVSYSNNVNVGTATVTITGIGDYTGSRNVTFTINADPNLCVHVWGAWEMVTPASYIADGVEKRTCTICGEIETRPIPQSVYTATSISTLGTWLNSQQANSPTTAYKVKLNVNSLGGQSGSSGSLGYVLTQNNTKYVSIDLSGSNINSIDNNAFYECISLTSITIPDSVTSIADIAFCKTGLTNITIPNNVTSIGRGVFEGCTSLTSINIPNNVASIGELAFQSCTSLTAITVDAGNSAYSSQDGILYNKNKTTLVVYPSGKTGNTFTIPASVNSIEIGAFSGCFSLTAINVDAGNSTYISDNGVLYNKVKTTLVAYPSGKTGSFTIPNSVNSIEDQAFSGCTSLTSITISNSVNSIGTAAFRYCANLTGVTIPNSVNTIGAGAFSDCTNLASITFQGTIAGDKLGLVLSAPINITISPFSGDLRDKYLANGTGTYTTTAPVNNTSVWARQQP